MPTDWHAPEALSEADGRNSLRRARALQQRAAEQGFDWADLVPLWDKLQEEIGEAQAAVATGDTAEIRDELGDLLFVLVNLCRHLQVNPDEALDACSDKFRRRLAYVQDQLETRGSCMEAESLETLEGLWQAAKTPKLRPPGSDR